MARDQIDMTPIETRDELVAWFAAGCKPKEKFRVGTEHEKFAFTVDGHRPVPYAGPRGIRALLDGMQHLLGWEPIMEGENIIGLADVTGGGAISLEPGGQFELSGAPLETVHQTCNELMAHLAQLREVARPLGIGFLGIGMTPDWTRADMPVMPKGRYKIMTAYMPKVGTLGLDMMYRTCTVQTNHDFSSEADMVKKLRVGLALQPVATALFANSPFTEGKPNGFVSFRSEIWRDTDNARAGMLPLAFEPGMGFERYVDYALDVPMYFVKRGDSYIDVSGRSFRDHLAGKLHPRRARHHVGLGQPHLDDFSGGAAQAIPRDARLRRRAVARAAVAAGVLVRHPLRRRQPRRGLGHRQGLDRRGAPEAARRRAEARLQGDDPRPRPAQHRDRTAAHRAQGPAAPQQARPQRPRRDALSAAAGGDRRSRHHAGRGDAGGVSRTVGTARSIRSTPNTPTKATPLLRRAARFRQVVQRRDDVLGERVGQRRGFRADCGSGRRGRPATRGSRRRIEHAHAGPQRRIPETPKPPARPAPRPRPRRRWRWCRACGAAGRSSPGTRSRRAASRSWRGRARAASGSSVCVECRADVTHSSRSRRKVSEAGCFRSR